MAAVVCRKEYCIGCRLCEVFCVAAHSGVGNLLLAWRQVPRPRPRVLVEEKEEQTLAVQCQHCAEAPCLEACISGAMVRDAATGAVICREDRCVGCWSCVMVCPFGAVVPHEAGGRRHALKCDLCAGSEAPWCVAHCPNRALVLVREEEAGCRPTT
ncbi:MAG: 4Fe-4S dicluster domain-containing protein [Clostridia bacterium]|nr:4Fe-4S dicluster domain-containing protein [Clostridia bacterium]MDH7573940.1 4Fe-4S dicluster domain-containing protein [Clostridia bacterium]